MPTQRLALLLAAPLLLASSACLVDPEPRDTVYYDPAPPPPVPNPGPTTSTVGITTGQTLASDGGQGAGVLVEYLGGGQWYVWTVCDTFLTGLVCAYDVTLALEPGAAFVSVAEEPVDADNSNDARASGTQATVIFDTQTEVDGVLAQVDPPGAPLFVRATLDGRLDPEFMFWIDETGAVRHGSPTNPVWFAPTTP
jgi:hypothetical protein